LLTDHGRQDGEGICGQMTTQDGQLGVIFDMDGVLVDSGWAHRQAWYDLAAKEGMEMSDEFFRRTFGMQNDAILPLLRPGISKEDMDALADWKEQRYREVVAERVTLSDGAEALLRDLKAQGFRLAIGSSAPPENLDVFWSVLSLADYFQARVTKEEIPNSKPAPDTFLRAAQKLGLPADRCAVVEDAVAGIDAARAAGMPVVAVTSTRPPEALVEANRVVCSLSELNASDFFRLLEGVDGEGSP
jgi:beta-phosphoglucomutase family hydrolase